MSSTQSAYAVMVLLGEMFEVMAILAPSPQHALQKASVLCVNRGDAHAKIVGVFSEDEVEDIAQLLKKAKEPSVRV